jgi:S-methylmethionine-dependent homocysteine/selenocysteine methylase
MHSSPEITREALDILLASWSGPLAVYPESGYFKSPDWVFTDLTPSELVGYARDWRKQGVNIFGGCCGIRPSHIEALAKEMT